MSSQIYRCVRHLVYACLTVLSLVVSERADAQWSIRATVGEAHFVKMMDEVGQPHIGYIGIKAGGLLRSEDTGHTWTHATFEQDIRDEMYDISFKDEQTGFAVGQLYAYKTTDGGLTWYIMSDLKARAIHYSKGSGIVFASCWSQSSVASSNEGVTWYTFASADMNGFAHIDDSRVMMAGHDGFARYSIDGGASWEPSNLSSEVYQPVALKTRGWYVGASEIDHTIWRSTNGGEYWELLDQISNPVGCIRGSDNNLILQTRSGMYRSTDQGDDWIDICGPSSLADTRFWVRGLEIFAVSYSGLLYYNPTSSSGIANPKFNITPSPLNLSTDGCNIPTGLIHVSTDACATRLMEVSVVGSSEFVFTGLSTLPAPMNSSAEIPIVYQAVGNNVDSAMIRLRIDMDGVGFDTFVMVYGRTAPAINPSATPSRVDLAMSSLDCRVDAKKVTVVNSGCDAFRIDSMRLSDPQHFSIVGLSFPTNVPGLGSHQFTVQSNSTSVKKSEGALFLYVSNSAGAKVLKVDLVLKRVGPSLRPMEDRRFTFNSTCEPQEGELEFINMSCDTIIVDSVRLSNNTHFKLLPMTLPRVLARDQYLTIPFEVYVPSPASSSRATVFMRTLGQTTQQIAYISASATVKPALPDDTVQFVASGLCPDFDSTFAITNVHCEPIRVVSLTPAIQPSFTVSLPQTPLELAPNATAEIGIHTNAFVKGTSRTSIVMRYEVYGNIFDTIIHVAVRNQNAFTIDPKLAKVNFGRISVCAPQTRTVFIDNKYCIPVSIDRLALSAASSNSFSIVYQPVPQRTLAPGERDSVVLQFAPDAIGARTAAIEVRMKSAVVTLDTFFTVEGIGTGSVNANIRDEKLDLGTAFTCQRLEQTTTVRNDGCVPLAITSVTPNSGTFALATPTLPYTIAPGDSVTLTFEVLTTAIGTHNETAIVRLVSDQNIEQLLECALTATLNVEAQRFEVPPLVLGQLDGCQPFDTTILVRNPLLCDAIEMSASFSSPDASIVGQSTAIISPGRFFVFALRIQPNTSGSVGLRLRSSLLDTTIQIPYSFSVGGGTYVITGPTDTLRTDACDVIYDTLYLSHYGCGYGMVGGLTLIPVGGTATKFSFVVDPPPPIDLNETPLAPVAIKYDPNAPGSNSAFLQFFDEEGETHSFPLNADFTPVGSMGASITSAGAKSVIVGESFDVDLEVSASLPQPVVIDDLIAELEYDTDLLTFTNVSPQGDWTLLNQNSGSGGGRLAFSHPASTLGANLPLARLTFKTAVARDKTGTIRLKGVQINSANPDFEKCVASNVFHQSSNDASVTFLCGGETLSDALNGKLPVSNIVVRPHPASAADRVMNVSFESEIDAEVGVELVNVLGVTTSSMQMNAHTGRNEIQLPLNGAGKGWHLLRLKTSLGNAGIRVMLTD